MFIWCTYELDSETEVTTHRQVWVTPKKVVVGVGVKVRRGSGKGLAAESSRLEEERRPLHPRHPVGNHYSPSRRKKWVVSSTSLSLARYLTMPTHPPPSFLPSFPRRRLHRRWQAVWGVYSRCKFPYSSSVMSPPTTIDGGVTGASDPCRYFDETALHSCHLSLLLARAARTPAALRSTLGLFPSACNVLVGRLVACFLLIVLLDALESRVYSPVCRVPHLNPPSVDICPCRWRWKCSRWGWRGRQRRCRGCQTPRSGSGATHRQTGRHRASLHILWAGHHSRVSKTGRGGYSCSSCCCADGGSSSSWSWTEYRSRSWTECWRRTRCSRCTEHVVWQPTACVRLPGCGVPAHDAATTEANRRWSRQRPCCRQGWRLSTLERPSCRSCRSRAEAAETAVGKPTATEVVAGISSKVWRCGSRLWAAPRTTSTVRFP